MSEKAVYKLKINMEFKNLIRPLQKKEFLQLEANILSDGCRDPIANVCSGSGGDPFGTFPAGR